jgi:patatin-related protein
MTNSEPDTSTSDAATLKEELRLAVVIYGGASLAVYMHGVTKELLKLVRASKVLHEMGLERAQSINYGDSVDRREFDTEAIYFDLLKAINRKKQFRVVIDVIAGASAGAINGVMLAKAVVDDALLDSQTALWLGKADVDHLGREVSVWDSWYLYPIVKVLSYLLPKEIKSNPETRQKIARLLRSSWFTPPFSGSRLCHHFLDALKTMRRSRREGSTLLPRGLRLDVYASITDLVGYPRTVQLHEELVAREREHGAFCRLTHIETEIGRQSSDFVDDNDPALVWAARASSCYAGIFPPFQHRELCEVLDERDMTWEGERTFLTQSIYGRDGTPAVRLFDPRERLFVDGGIVNNKPFTAALDALNHRSADRRVDRCIVYIEPDPSFEATDDPDKSLGYLGTIGAALSTIPRNQPILDELNALVDQDARVQTNRRIVDTSHDYIRHLVAELMSAHLDQPLSADLLRRLRGSVVERAAEELGLAFRAYVQRRVWRLRDALVDEWSLLAEDRGRGAVRRAMTTSVGQWWQPRTGSELTLADLQRDFLNRFDVTYRTRRMQFVIRRLNQTEGLATTDSRSEDAIEEFKRATYGFLARFYERRRAETVDVELVAKLAEAAKQVPLAHEGALELLEQLALSLALEGLDRDFDEAFVTFCSELPDMSIRQKLVADYVGFLFYDVLLMTPGTETGGPDPLTRIRIERVSPADANTLHAAFKGLRGRELMGFVGFFNRGYREHDYLWGRLDGADRIVDLLLNAAEGAIDNPGHYRQRLFEAILKTERSQLYRCDQELKDIARAVDELSD